MNAQEQTEKINTPVQFFSSEQIAQLEERMKEWIGKKELVATTETKIDQHEKTLTLFFFMKRLPLHFSFSTLTTLDSAIKQIDRKLKLSWYQFGKSESRFFPKYHKWLTIDIRQCDNEHESIFLLG